MLYNVMSSELGPIRISRNDSGIDGIYFLDSNKPFTLDEACQQNDNDPLIKEAGKQLKAYFAGKLQNFSLPISLNGTDFQVRVWKALMTIPYGQTWSYKDLAIAIGNPLACRAVGGANNKNKLSIIVP